MLKKKTSLPCFSNCFNPQSATFPQVKLKLVWSTLISPLIPRLRTGAVDMEVTPNPHLSEEGKAEYLAEVKRRQTLQPLGISEPETILDIHMWDTVFI